ncbi:MAG: hypothetical protein Q9195_004179 [Heterodermia aff. obscurata]
MHRADIDTQSSETEDILIRKEVKRTWRSYVWDTLDKSPEERRFLFKLDFALLTFASLGYFIKYLDQSNINNAFVSGMKEQLSLYKNELNYMQTCWTVGYVVGQIPSNIVLTRFRPSIWIPSMEPMYFGAPSLAEGSFYPGMQYVIGSWYRKDELAKRSCIFHTSSAIATMCSGYLMASVYHLGGRNGFAGWQWLFIVDGVISLPIAIAGFFFLPDVPEISRAWYLTKEVRAIFKATTKFKLTPESGPSICSEANGIRGPQAERSIFQEKSQEDPDVLAYISANSALCASHLVVKEAQARLTYSRLFNNGAAGAAPVFAQYLKDSKHPKYSVPQINDYPTTTYAVQIVTTLAYAWSSDSFLNGNRLPPIIFGAVSYMGLGTRSQNAWAHEICADDNEERAIVVATMNEMAYVLQAWLPLIVWQQVDAPEYRKGFITITFLSAALIGVGIVTKVLHRRQIARCVRLLPIGSGSLLKPFNSRTQAGVDKGEVRQREGSDDLAAPVEVHATGKLLYYATLHNDVIFEHLIATSQVVPPTMQVGIVGAGISGVVAGAHIGRADIDYTIFERSSAPGGIWLYDDRIDLDSTYPATRPSGGEETGSKLNLTNGDSEIKHAPPGPCYDGLTNNVSTRMLKLQLNSWPPGTVDYVNHRVINDYIRDTSEKVGVNERTLYNTKVEKIEKSGAKWRFKTTTLSHDRRGPKKLDRSWNVLLIGAGTSSTDIARELGSEASTIYQTSRGGKFDLPPTLLPANGFRVSDIEFFRTPTLADSENEPDLDPTDPIPYQVILRDKRVLSDIHRVIVCTGYHISLPFLSDYHSDGTPASQATDTILVTDGTQVHNLHKDIFYIPDPTLTFIGVPYFTATFTLFEFQAVALAAVLSGKAQLPSQDKMRGEYQEKLREKGSGKTFHSLKGQEVQYVNSLVDWLNRDGQRLGAKPVEGHTAAWHAADADRMKFLEEILGRKFLQPDTLK